jgi:hypothetical protein
MAPRARANIAVVAAGLCGIWALGGILGTLTMIFFGTKGVDYPPLYPPMGVVLTLATIYLLRYRKKMRRIEQGLCVRCGYDLTGNVSGACPECGTAKAID